MHEGNAPLLVLSWGVCFAKGHKPSLDISREVILAQQVHNAVEEAALSRNDSDNGLVSSIRKLQQRGQLTEVRVKS